MVTMNDIAKKAGVSQATVSYVINNREKGIIIKKETRRKVERIAQKLGYRPNLLARSVATGKTNVLSFIALSLEQEFVGRIFQGVAKKIQKEGYVIKIYHVDNKSDISAVVDSTIEQRPEGIICYGKIDNYLKKSASNYNICLALVDNDIDDESIVSVNSNDFEGGFLATKHLIELGHQKIAFIYASGIVKLREEGYVEALRTSGIKVDPVLIIKTSVGDKEIYKKISQLLEKRTTAIFCSGDPLAMRALQGVSKAGLSVPEDISIVGYADLGISELANPRLTTVRQPFEKMGEKVAEKIIARIEKKKVRIMHEKLDVELVVRDSTAKCR